MSRAARPAALRWLAPALALTLMAACGTDPRGPEATASTSVEVSPAVSPGWQDQPPVLVGAGDIVMCRTTGDEATAALVEDIPGVVVALGDNVYPAGTIRRYAECYEESWGRHRWRTRPAIGNHEYMAGGPKGYFGYFGDLAGPAQLGYYAYPLGAWRVYSLNSHVVDEAQVEWLRAELAAHPAACTVAYWHHPLFSSGYHGNNPAVRPLWELLEAAGAEVVVAGHDHDYERFAPQLASGEPHAGGIRSFVVGTGGAPLSDIIEVQPNSEVRQNTSRGVLELRLGDGTYAWRFVSVDGEFDDAGEGVCHDP